MPRKRKQDIKVNDSTSLEGLMQETYNDACLQITDSQKAINELASSVTPEDVDDHTKIAKEKGNLLKVKESGVKIKLELAKLQSDILKHGGDSDAVSNERVSGGAASLTDFKKLREELQGGANSGEDNEPN